jgi:protein TonB
MHFRFIAVFVLLLLLLFISAPIQSGEKEYPGEDDFIIIDTPAQMIQETTPVYPDSAIAKKIEGTVWIRALVDKTGKVVEAKVIRCTTKNCGFELAALEAAKKCVYTPAMQNGKPVAVWVAYKVQFALAEGKEK